MGTYVLQIVCMVILLLYFSFGTFHTESLHFNKFKKLIQYKITNIMVFTLQRLPTRLCLLGRVVYELK